MFEVCKIKKKIFLQAYIKMTVEAFIILQKIFYLSKNPENNVRVSTKIMLVCVHMGKLVLVCVHSFSVWMAARGCWFMCEFSHWVQQSSKRLWPQQPLIWASSLRSICIHWLKLAGRATLSTFCSRLWSLPKVFYWLGVEGDRERESGDEQEEEDKDKVQLKP